MDLSETFTKPLKDFAKNSIRLVKRCSKPDIKGKQKVHRSVCVCVCGEREKEREREEEEAGTRSIQRERERERERERARAKIFLAGLLNRRWNKQTKRTVASQITSPPQP